jgi:hypothetical protein
MFFYSVFRKKELFLKNSFFLGIRFFKALFFKVVFFKIVGWVFLSILFFDCVSVKKKNLDLSLFRIEEFDEKVEIKTFSEEPPISLEEPPPVLSLVSSPSSSPLGLSPQGQKSSIVSKESFIEGSKPSPSSASTSTSNTNSSVPSLGLSSLASLEVQNKNSKHKKDPKDFAKERKSQKEPQKESQKKGSFSDKKKVPSQNNVSSSVVVDSQVKKTSLLRQPLIEGQEGFRGRRPFQDPFSQGEKVTYAVSYMGVTAGHMSLEVLPFVQVNDRKHYHFRGQIWTTLRFSKIYSVQDSISSMVDFELLRPTVYKLQVEESGQKKESRFYIDWVDLRAFFWEKKITEKSGLEEKKHDWLVEPFSQDIFSSLFYLRVFPWDTGVERAFPVADDKQNLIYKGKVLRKEYLKIKAGEFQTLVLEPKIELQGKFKPSGEIYIWLSDDHRKLILKIQAKVTMGSLIAEATEVKP